MTDDQTDTVICTDHPLYMASANCTGDLCRLMKYVCDAALAIATTARGAFA
eukprot:CAMPEP_0198537830 /NCGR_PEP_ID=MMETSP1462-20131121/45330_1 /TAXON_ID=1333877 /ORGANISM="Brandtodinium nutriculum, Strain RCC3387" /LENGTH=50 /DNA_ID=CAMNT_0044267835 /DNA_START=100 /DNA_END=249 /DNA_ORIENTATION=-